MLTDDAPCSPLKKLKILGEKTQNVKTSLEGLAPIKENISSSKEREASQSENTTEHLLEDAPGKYVIFPINHDDMWKMYKHLVDNFWSVTESIQDLEKLALNYDEKQFMKFFTSIFASPKSSGLVNENFAEEFCKIIQVTEAKFFYGHQLFVQNIHSEMYNKLLLHFTEDQEREKTLKIVENFDAVTNKRNWIEKWKTSSFAEQLVASGCLHGLMFCSLDIVHNWLSVKTRSILSHEIIDIFEKMILDQEIQRNFSCLMISHLRHKPTKERMLEIINQAAKLEFEFLINGLKCDLIGVETDEIIQLIDKKTKELKVMMFSWFNEKKKVTTDSNENTKPLNTQKQENELLKENHQKLVFDEDF